MAREWVVPGEDIPASGDAGTSPSGCGYGWGGTNGKPATIPIITGSNVPGRQDLPKES